MVICHLKLVGNVKRIKKWAPHELTANFKNCHLEMLFSLILCNSNEPFLDWIVTWDKIWILCDHQQWPAQWLDWEAPKHFQSQMCLNPGEIIASEKYTQQINEVHLKLKHLEPILVNRKSPNLLCNDTQKHVTQQRLQMLNELDYEVLFHLPYSFGFLPTDEHFFKHLDNFLQEKCFHKQQDS